MLKKGNKVSGFRYLGDLSPVGRKEGRNAAGTVVALERDTYRLEAIGKIGTRLDL